MKHLNSRVIVYQTKSGAIELKGDLKHETIWAHLQQIADLFDTDKSGISRHIFNVYKTKELDKQSTVAKIATVQVEGDRQVKRKVTYYNLDVILSVGYRVNSKKATIFRQWATKTLRQHITQGFTINKSRIKHNYDVFLSAVNTVKALLPGELAESASLIELIKTYAYTWVSLDAYDKSTLPASGITKKQIDVNADMITNDIQSLKHRLIEQKLAGDLFAIERDPNSVSGIFGNVFQSFDGQDVYPTIEEKAAHLLYFMVKNHPFVDGNKRSAAFSFIWFMNKVNKLNLARISPESLTMITLLVAESQPSNKDKMIGLILLLLNQSSS